MIFHAFIVGLFLTGASAMLIAMKLGSDGLLYGAALGASVVWLLPGAMMLAAPAGAFGGVLFRQAERSSRRRSRRRNLTIETLSLAVVAMIVSVLTVGWLVPRAHRETDRAIARVQQDDAMNRELPRFTFEGVPLDELLAQSEAMPGAWQELLRRATWIAASFLLPLVASVFITVKPRWTYGGATIATLAVFAISVQLVFQGVA